MRKLFSTLFILGLILSLTSCKDKLPSMSAKVDGIQKNFIFRSTTLGDVPALGEGFLIIATTGSDSTHGEYLALLVRGADKGSYDLDVALNGKYQCEALYRKRSDDSTTYIGKTGTITITDINKRKHKVSGTFNMTMVNKLLNTDQITISEGQFTNLFYAKIDATLPSNVFNP